MGVDGLLILTCGFPLTIRAVDIDPRRIKACRRYELRQTAWILFPGLITAFLFSSKGMTR
jgi:hypothetical protein